MEGQYLYAFFPFCSCYKINVILIHLDIFSISQILSQDQRSDNRKSAVLELKGMLVVIQFSSAKP